MTDFKLINQLLMEKETNLMKIGKDLESSMYQLEETIYNFENKNEEEIDKSYINKNENIKMKNEEKNEEKNENINKEEIILNCKKNMTGRNRRGIPITKDNVIYARILVCLVPGFFVLYGTLGLILESNSKILCIFLICFATIIGCGMLYGINKSIEDED